MELSREIKSLLATPGGRIKLRDVVYGVCRSAASRLIAEDCLLDSNDSASTMSSKLTIQERILSDVGQVQILIAYWGFPSHLQTLCFPIRGLYDCILSENPKQRLEGLDWYPGMFLLYLGGIASVAADNYTHLRRLLEWKCTGLPSVSDGGEEYLLKKVVRELRYYEQVFNDLSEGKNYRVPRSEHLFRACRSISAQLLYLESEYEECFDRFELMLALQYSFMFESQEGRVWGPVGRFAYKHQALHESSPVHRLIAEAHKYGQRWLPVEAGLFGGDIDQFNQISSAYSDRVSQLGWG